MSHTFSSDTNILPGEREEFPALHTLDSVQDIHIHIHIYTHIYTYLYSVQVRVYF